MRRFRVTLRLLDITFTKVIEAADRDAADEWIDDHWPLNDLWDVDIPSWVIWERDIEEVTMT